MTWRRRSKGKERSTKMANVGSRKCGVSQLREEHVPKPCGEENMELLTHGKGIEESGVGWR